MHARFIVIAVAALASTSAFAAEPAKPAPQPAARTQPRVVLASAEQVQTAAPADQQAVAPKPHRIARVTTCRCGGQQAQPDEQQ